LDVNARIGASFRLFVCRDGLDIVRAMYLDRTGQKIPEDIESDGRKWIVEDRDLRSSYTYYRENTLTIGEWLRSLRGVKEAAWFAFDDPIPFLIQFFHVFEKKLRGIMDLFGALRSRFFRI
jgi:D-aspartate ligase